VLTISLTASTQRARQAETEPAVAPTPVAAADRG
jgi:hypothetical protein